jgi:hypothetical protein
MVRNNLWNGWPEFSMLLYHLDDTAVHCAALLLEHRLIGHALQ